MYETNNTSTGGNLSYEQFRSRKLLDDLSAVLARLLDQSAREVRQGTSTLDVKSTILSRVVSSLALTVLSIAQESGEVDVWRGGSRGAVGIYNVGSRGKSVGSGARFGELALEARNSGLGVKNCRQRIFTPVRELHNKVYAEVLACVGDFHPNILIPVHFSVLIFDAHFNTLFIYATPHCKLLVTTTIFKVLIVNAGIAHATGFPTTTPFVHISTVIVS
jgi:hypothetical protein